MVTIEQIQAVADKIAKVFQPEKIILFGSYAWGKPGPDSDVDLCVIKDVENTRASAVEVRIIAYPRSFPLDVIVYRPVAIAQDHREGDFFVNDIITKGKILYAQ